jgi:hypothetical protein
VEEMRQCGEHLVFVGGVCVCHEAHAVLAYLLQPQQHTDHTQRVSAKSAQTPTASPRKAQTIQHKLALFCIVQDSLH